MQADTSKSYWGVFCNTSWGMGAEGSRSSKNEKTFHTYIREFMAEKFVILTFSILISAIKNNNSFADRQQASTSLFGIT